MKPVFLTGIDFASDAYDMLATNSDESIKGLDTKLEHIEHMLTGNLNCQKDLRQYLRNSNESRGSPSYFYFCEHKDA